MSLTLHLTASVFILFSLWCLCVFLCFCHTFVLAACHSHTGNHLCSSFFIILFSLFHLFILCFSGLSPCIAIVSTCQSLTALGVELLLLLSVCQKSLYINIIISEYFTKVFSRRLAALSSVPRDCSVRNWKLRVLINLRKFLYFPFPCWISTSLCMKKWLMELFFVRHL